MGRGNSRGEDRTGVARNALVPLAHKIIVDGQGCHLATAEAAGQWLASEAREVVTLDGFKPSVAPQSLRVQPSLWGPTSAGPITTSERKKQKATVNRTSPNALLKKLAI